MIREKSEKGGCDKWVQASGVQREFEPEDEEQQAISDEVDPATNGPADIGDGDKKTHDV